jgi:secondary thiamine-phosphate synthase enzyme
MLLNIKTQKKKEVIDITDIVNGELNKLDVTEGLCSLFLKHTTAALTTADLDPGTDQDLLDALEAMSPKLNYRHPHNPKHAPDHILSSIIGTSLTIPVSNNQLTLGTWQRVVLIELDGPRDREIVFSLFNC